ncbi:hypothetical protein R6Q57_015166 [Mikania cordata]
MLLGVDDLDIFKGISLKLLAMEQLLIQHPEWLGRVVLVAYYVAAEYCLVTVVRDGMNLIPYEYVISRQGNERLDKVLGLDPCTPKKSMLVVSEFIGCSPSLSGAIRVNPWNIDAAADAMDCSLELSESEKQLRHEKTL